jgi:hypothetical protein
MKKIYQNPETTIIKVQTAKMIAVSTTEMYGKNATGSGMSRQGSSLWDDDDYDEE